MGGQGAAQIQWKKLLCKFLLWIHRLLFLSICLVCDFQAVENFTAQVSQLIDA